MSLGPSKLVPRKIKGRIKNNPKARRLIYPYYSKYLRYHIALLTRWKTSRKNDAEIDPFKLIYIDPNKIEFYSTNSISKGNGGLYLIPKIRDGDWDKNVEPFTELSIYKACNARFNQDKDWSETEYYQKMQEKIRTGESKGGVSKIVNIDRYFQNLDNLYEDIKKNGYKEQTELESERKDFHVNQRKIVDRYLGELNEVVINIDRNGNYLFEDGRHRLAIAKILDIDKIPVRIFLRHKIWQEKRNSHASSSKKQEDSLKDHPDIEK